MNKQKISMVSGFIASLRKFPDRTALEVDEQAYTYAQLGQLAGSIAAAINDRDNADSKVVAIYAYRSVTAYAGILGILMSGRGYAPLNPEFPIERTSRMLSLSGAKTLIVGKECLEQLKELLPLIKGTMTVILPDTDGPDETIKGDSKLQFVFAADLPDNREPLQEPSVDPDSTAYLLFTSGSTGVPKGICVSHRNVRSYVEYICARYKVNEQDRFSQAFDMTFDLSVHDMFVCWERGACLCCVPRKFVMAPAKFIKDKQLTMWFSVPSVAMFMSRMRMLAPGAYPSLRYSLFCGEPLPAVLAAQWQEAAANSTVENLYGPTEATIAITHYTWDRSASPDQCVNGVVPIGNIFDNQNCCIIDKHHKVVEQGQQGELCLNGTQVTKGYLNNPEKTKSQYIQIASAGEGLWYRTGDLVKQDQNGCLYYLGRIDNQVQILGFRVELQEVDHALRRASGSQMAISVAWPKQDGNAAGIVGFVVKQDHQEEAQVLEQCKRMLPEYMVPKRVYFVDRIPLNSNGKMDRGKLEEMLDQKVIK